MKTVAVNASRSYNVIIGNDLIKNIAGHLLPIHKQCTAAIICDSNVWPLYGNAIKQSLEIAGYNVIQYVFPAGEASKTAETYLAIVNFLAENHVTRSDILLALGGGVTGDMAGFAAATYLRGIAYVQIPTTLLSMVDSSVGGKTAIDLSVGKNLLGAFYQPSLVLCDIDALESLPEDIFRDGCAEVIKYGILYDEKLFLHLMENDIDFDREYVISRCVELKRNVVAQDEFDTGARQMLNLGHTIGHGIEAQSNFTVSHGKAVAIGMSIISKAACSMGICSNVTYDTIRNILLDFALPVDTEFTAKQIFETALSDKKRSGSKVNLIVPESIGNCKIHPVPVSELQSFIEAGM